MNLGYKFDIHYLTIQLEDDETFLSSIRIPLLQLKQAMDEAEFANKMKRFDKLNSNVQEEMVKN